MSKRKIILAGVGFLAAIGVIGGIRVIGENQGEELVEPGGGSVKTVQTEETREVLYEDAAGFSFKLPEDLVVEDKTEQAGKEYYTVLEINKNQGPRTRDSVTVQGRDRGNQGNQGEPGNQGELITVVIKDTKYKTVEEWLEKDEEAPTGAKLAGAVGLDEISAKQYAQGDKIWTAAIDLGALYLIEGTKKGDNWPEVYNRLVETFAFAEPEPAQKTAGSAGSGGGSVPGNVIYEAEEVIE